MSGGSLDYAYLKIKTIIEAIDEELDGEDQSIVGEGAGRLRYLRNELDVVVDAVQAAEWWLSGDTGVDPFLEIITQLIERNMFKEADDVAI